MYFQDLARFGLFCHSHPDFYSCKFGLCFKTVYHRFRDFPDSSVGKESACNARDPGSILGSGRSAGEGVGYPLQYSWASCGRHGFDTWVGMIPWGRERLPTPVFWPGELHGLYSHGVAKSQTQLSDFPFHHYFNLWVKVKKKNASLLSALPSNPQQ